MSSCAKCGACATVCPVYRNSGREGHSARGKLHLIDVLGLAESSTVFVDIFSACLLCGACSAICPRQIDIEQELIAARNSFSALSGPHSYEKYLARKLLDYPGSLAGLRLLGRACGKVLGGRLPDDSGLRLRLAMFRDDAVSASVTEDVPAVAAGGTILTWFPGCSARYLFPDVLASCRTLLAKNFLNLHFPKALVCCGLAHWAAGDIEAARRSGRKNIEALEETDGPILVSCASCYSQLKKYPKLFAGVAGWQQRAEKMAMRAVELSAFLEGLESKKNIAGVSGKERIKVFYHDPCHLRHDANSVDMSRQQLLKLGNVEIVELPDGPRCCGQGGLFHVAQPEISAGIRDRLVADVLALKPDIVTTSCSGCLMQWQQGLAAVGSDVRVLHLAQLLKGTETA